MSILSIFVLLVCIYSGSGRLGKDIVDGVVGFVGSNTFGIVEVGNLNDYQDICLKIFD
ncbi:hypothetical protein [Vibrio furnissii]|uniref:hypothetical protein n=1 Tax=Vibrio furnissii TaxID=29494 RepID=UPI0013024EA9|nr:hypothetical protein [Vibrio furnissii]